MKNNPRKILIFGIPGSGKSTFAILLGKSLQLPVLHLDKYFFTKGWKERNYEEFLQIQRELVGEEAWIIDGNATKSLEMRYSQADLVLYFKFNRLLCLWRIFKRSLFKHSHLSDLPEGCSKNVRFRLIRYLFGFPSRVKKNLQELKLKYPHAVFYELNSKYDLSILFKKISELV